MATYKIPQNVEAEDKLIGPFSFKQFIFLILGFNILGYLVGSHCNFIQVALVVHLDLPWRPFRLESSVVVAEIFFL